MINNNLVHSGYKCIKDKIRDGAIEWKKIFILKGNSHVFCKLLYWMKKLSMLRAKSENNTRRHIMKVHLSLVLLILLSRGNQYEVSQVFNEFYLYARGPVHEFVTLPWPLPQAVGPRLALLTPFGVSRPTSKYCHFKYCHFSWLHLKCFFLLYKAF